MLAMTLDDRRGVRQGEADEPAEAFDADLKYHQPLMSAWNQRRAHPQVIYNSTVLSTQLSTVQLV